MFDFIQIKRFISVIVLLLLIDTIWLKFFAQPAYNKMIKEIQGSEEMKPNLLMAAIVYIAMTVLLLLCLSKNFSISELFIVGFTSYAIYDFTNAAIFYKWNKLFGLFDSLWGVFLFAVVGYIFQKYNL